METRKEIGSAIWRINQAVSEVADELELTGGEMTEAVTAKLEQMDLTSMQVVDGLQQYSAAMDAKMDALDREIKRLQAIKKSAKNSLEGIKRYMLNTMLENGVTCIEGELATAKVMQGRESVQVDEELLLSHYSQTIEEMQAKLPDYIKLEAKVGKTEIGLRLKAGEMVPNATLVRNPTLKIS